MCANPLTYLFASLTHLTYFGNSMRAQENTEHRDEIYAAVGEEEYLGQSELDCSIGENLRGGNLKILV